MVSGIGGIQNPNNDFVLDRDLVIEDANGVERIRLDHETGGIIIRNRSNEIVFRWEMPGNNLRCGGHGKDFDLLGFPSSATNLTDISQSTLHFNGQRGSLRLGGGEIPQQEPIPGKLVCLDNQGNQTIFLNGASGEVAVGANGQNGNLVLQNEDNEPIIQIDAQDGTIVGERLLLRPSGSSSWGKWR